MKGETKHQPDLAPREEQAILDQIQNDRDLIARLHITPQELEALSKCALLGTLTCKQDMLFILRQIREASSPAIDHTTLFPQPAPRKELGDDSAHRQIATRVAPIVLPGPDSLESTNRRRIPERFGVLFWAMVLVVGVAWNGWLIMSRTHGNFMTTFGAAVSADWDGWYSKLDHMNVLLFWEVLMVVAIAGAIHLKSRRDSRRFKVRPGRR
ncbi:MAG TPA: hypothetical protein VNT29_00480 [Candidatus Limnocylindrales bacterium]|nr:hypothetical protein [Candidatus Limnocylindrales bacterium]